MPTTLSVEIAAAGGPAVPDPQLKDAVGKTLFDLPGSTDLFRGIQSAQDDAYEKFENQGGGKPPRVLIVIEEAHEFLSEERIDKTPILFQQVARIAKRGRNRWLGRRLPAPDPAPCQLRMTE